MDEENKPCVTEAGLVALGGGILFVLACFATKAIVRLAEMAQTAIGS